MSRVRRAEVALGTPEPDVSSPADDDVTTAPAPKPTRTPSKSSKVDPEEPS